MRECWIKWFSLGAEEKWLKKAQRRTASGLPASLGHASRLGSGRAEYGCLGSPSDSPGVTI